jgi:hypothetical protein
MDRVLDILHELVIGAYLVVEAGDLDFVLLDGLLDCSSLLFQLGNLFS